MSINSEIERIKSAVNVQTGLIEQIKSALQGKAAGDGEGGITPSGTKNISSNGIHDVTLYEKANVNVPIPDDYIKPDGVKSITQNGDYDVTAYSGVTVNVPQPVGVKQITKNGTYDVFSFESADVNVPIPEGYIKPAGIKNITENGIHDATEYESVEVDVPIPDGYIVPEGTKQITENGVYDATEYKSVDVNVPIPDGYVLPAGALVITENGNYGVVDYAGVSVNVPSKEPVIQPLEINENGTYTPPEGVDGYSPITVNVAGSGGSGYTDLPEGYKRVDYIQFTGEQTVDTGIICNQNTKIKADFTREKSSQHYLLGVASSGNTASVTAYLGGSFRFGNKSASKIPNTNEDMIYSVILSSSEITITDSKTTISAVNAFETVGTLQLGGCRNSSGTDGAPQFVGKIPFFAMWQGEEQVLKLVPVVSAEGQYRFFDMVSKTFFDSITETPLNGGNF